MLCLVSMMMSRRQKKQQWSKGGVERAQEFKIQNSLRIWKMWDSHVYPPETCAGQTYTSFLVHTTFPCGIPCVLLYLTICELPASWHKAWPYQIGARVHFPSLSPRLNSRLLTTMYGGGNPTLSASASGGLVGRGTLLYVGGYISAFDTCLMPLSLCRMIILLLWEENYGESSAASLPREPKD